jgi:hypothetical protein
MYPPKYWPILTQTHFSWLPNIAAQTAHFALCRTVRIKGAFYIPLATSQARPMTPTVELGDLINVTVGTEWPERKKYKTSSSIPFTPSDTPQTTSQLNASSLPNPTLPSQKHNSPTLIPPVNAHKMRGT